MTRPGLHLPTGFSQLLPCVLADGFQEPVACLPTPSSKRSKSPEETASARRVLPEPPGPDSVSRRLSASRSPISSISRPRPTKLDSSSGRLFLGNGRPVALEDATREPGSSARSSLKPCCGPGMTVEPPESGLVADTGTIPQTVPAASSIAIADRCRQPWRLEQQVGDTGHRRQAPDLRAFGRLDRRSRVAESFSGAGCGVRRGAPTWGPNFREAPAMRMREKGQGGPGL
jgi:hypothetical protein